MHSLERIQLWAQDMPASSDDQSAQGSVNLLLPEGLSPDRYHALARKLVDALGRLESTPDTAEAATSRRSVASSGYVTLSKLSSAPPENTPVLNDSTWVLTVPAPAEGGAQAVDAMIRGIPEALGVKVEYSPRHRIS